jgi:hypothetical protein
MTNCRTCKRPTETGCLSCNRANAAMRKANKGLTDGEIVADLLDAWNALEESRKNGGWITNAVKKFFRVANRKYVTLALKEHYIENC